ncbi:tektin-1 [Fundulus heteroclitus]|uniref:tektin-1 n=1 Tax=Fundulus heteroclitus TaxID=8078 RepID=UPI00165A30C8|nr:tektin-1 [Fundulus heteroclitus]
MSVQDQKFEAPNFLRVDVVLNRAELFRNECKRLILETEKACRRMQSDDSKRLDQRVRDIQFLKKELELKLEEIVPEIDVLVDLQSRVRKALELNQEALRVTVLCLDDRRRRAPSERMPDEVNTELLKEWETYEEVASLLQSVQEQISEQIRLNRSAKYHLERDLREKFEAQNIDNSCALMTVHSIHNLQMSKQNTAGLGSLAVTPKQWENISDLTMAKAEQQKSNSLSLRALVESVLAQTATDMQKQFKATTEALQLHIQQIKSTKSLQEEKLPKILSEINSQQKIREDLQAAIAENEHFLTLAQSRLALRQQRPGKEQCHDPAQAQLLAEVQQLTAHINKLREEVAQSEEEQRALARCQLDLKESIDTKANSLYIDEVICMQHREPIIIRNF